MAIKRTQYMTMNIHINDLRAEGKWLIMDEANFDIATTKSNRTLISESRVFRKFCHTKESKFTLRRTEDGRIERDETGTKLYDEQQVNSAKEFCVVNLSSNDDKTYEIKLALAKGIKIRFADGTEVIYRRVLTSASQTRVGKRLFTCLDVKHVRNVVSYGAEFPAEVIISQMEARFGLAESSSIEITKEDFTFDIMPDYDIERTHDVVRYDWKTSKLNVEKDHTDTYQPLDGQGTILPSAAIRTAHRLHLVSRAEREYLLQWTQAYNEDVRLAEEEENEEFLRLWKKIPSAFQIRYGFTKGLLLVYAHNLETTDWKGSICRTTGKCMEFFGEETHYYDFSKDIMFTDSMWKENFDPRYCTDEVLPEHRVKLEIVLWQKNRLNDTVFMGYQYWQALRDTVSPKEYADEAISELSDTIFTDADHAKAFLGLYDTGKDADEYGEKMGQSGGKIQRVLELLNENPELISERYVQQTIRKTREKYIQDMGKGRIPVKGANPYVVSSPEVQFGNAPILEEGEYYYNGKTSRYAAFRSPLIDESEPTVVETIDVEEYHVLNQDILIMNVFDDICPRMGGMDTDGDKVALVEDDAIADAVKTELPMLYDAGFKGGKDSNTEMGIWKYDVKTVINDIKSIGEITNMATTWKDIAKNPRLMKRLGMTQKRVKEIVQILRFMQGWSIDYAKTGFFPEVPEYVMTLMSPEWKAWSRRQAALGIKGAEVFKSSSPLSQLWKGVKEYMDTKFQTEAKEITRDFTFEFTAGSDIDEISRIKPIIKEIETNYRHELSALRDMEMNEEEESEYVIHLIDKYQSAVTSIDSDIRSIASAAYLVSYFESSSKGKSISFPWVTAYDGLLLNIADSTDTKMKLRKAQINCHIDDVPTMLKFYRGVSASEDYEVTAKVPNGTYETFRRNGQLFIKMKAKSIVKVIEKRATKPALQTVTFEIKGFKHAGVTPHEVLDLLKANDGLIRVERKLNNKEQRAVVYVGKQQIGVAGRNCKAILATLLSEGGVELRVNNLDLLSPEFMSVKAGKLKPVSTFNFDMTVVQFIEAATPVEKVETEEQYDYDPSGEYYGSSDDSGYVPEDGTTSIVIDSDYFDDEEEEEAPAYYEMDTDVLIRMSMKADYWNVEVSSSEFNIVGASISVDDEGTFVTMYRGDGKKAVFEIAKDKVNKQFYIAGKVPANEKLAALALQVAHYEMYVDYIQRKQA